MNPVKIFVLILLLGLTSLDLFAQSKETYLSRMDAQVGEWLLDKESLKIEPATDRSIPDMKMVIARKGDSFERKVYYKQEKGDWTLETTETYGYDAKSKWLAYTGKSTSGEAYRGQLILMEDGKMHGVEFNANNQKVSELILDQVSADKTLASSKSFIYPQKADEDMEVITFQSTWLKQ